jgi:hypothetical protein
MLEYRFEILESAKMLKVGGSWTFFLERFERLIGPSVFCLKKAKILRGFSFFEQSKEAISFCI